MTAETRDPLRCTFCGKTEREVEQFVNGPNVRICNACVDICNEVIADRRAVKERADESERPLTRKTVYAGTLACPVCRAQFALHAEATEGHS